MFWSTNLISLLLMFNKLFFPFFKWATSLSIRSKFGDRLCQWSVNEAHCVLILCRFSSALFSNPHRAQVAHTARHQEHHNRCPDGERPRLTSDTPRYLRHRLIAAVTRTSRPVSAAFKQNSEADKRRMKSRLCVTGLRLPLLLGLPPTAAGTM